MNNGKGQVLRAHSSATDPRKAVREFHSAVCQPDMELVIFFCSSNYDLEALASEMRSLFAGIKVVGCTTAGEIGHDGFRNSGITGVSFPSDSFSAVADRIECLQSFEVGKGHRFVQELVQRMERNVSCVSDENSFAFLLIDGLSMREEMVAYVFQNALGKIPMIGGSAGDDLRFDRTSVYFDGRFCSDSAVLVLISTRLPFRIFISQNFIPTEKRVVVTKADSRHRLVYEIDGLPAAEVYGELVGMDSHKVYPVCFSPLPMVVLIGGRGYVRSIRTVNSDGSISFFCAIDEGIVLRTAQSENMIAGLERAFALVRHSLGAPQVVICFDCILRKLEMVQNDLLSEVENIYMQNRVTGFNTYGEIYNGTHVNQTLVGIAIGEVPMEVKEVFDVKD